MQSALDQRKPRGYRSQVQKTGMPASLETWVGSGASKVVGQRVAAEIFTVTLGYPLLPSIFIIKPVCVFFLFFWLHCEACGILVPYRLQ